jgi:hypothetical protein
MYVLDNYKKVKVVSPTKERVPWTTAVVPIFWQPITGSRLHFLRRRMRSGGDGIIFPNGGFRCCRRGRRWYYLIKICWLTKCTEPETQKRDSIISIVVASFHPSNNIFRSPELRDCMMSTKMYIHIFDPDPYGTNAKIPYGHLALSLSLMKDVLGVSHVI